MSQLKHTLFAGQAIGLVEIFKYSVGKERLAAGEVTYKLELSAPDGPSTAGGKQALQHIGLVPEVGSGTLVIGSVNVVERRAELRGHDHVAGMFRQRFGGASFPIERPAFEALLAKLDAFFRSQGVEVSAAVAPPVVAAKTGGPAPRARLTGAIPQVAAAPAAPSRAVPALLALVVLAAGAALLFFRG